MKDYLKGEILYIDKPYGVTSFGALARVRYLLSRALGTKRLKVGHAGTLDPLATGVLVLCTGKATKQIAQLQGHDKEYVATLQLGATTPSYDREHPVDNTYPTAHITLPMVEQVLQSFVGNILQVPPTYSAVKVNGDRAYDLKRKGKEIELEAKPIRIDAIRLQQFDSEKMTLTILVQCGKGTYIRSLARDIGKALQSGAYLTELRRTKVGDVTVEECVSLDHFDIWLQQNMPSAPQDAMTKDAISGETNKKEKGCQPRLITPKV